LVVGLILFQSDSHREFQIFHGYFIICIINKVIIACLVHDDPEFAADVVFKIVFVAVKMIFSDIGEYGTSGLNVLMSSS
jgi:hypothetical protein